jgi:hypothetical protein
VEFRVQVERCMGGGGVIYEGKVGLVHDWWITM